MPSPTRNLVRLAAVAVAFIFSIAQFQLLDFDCNEMPVLSVVSGTLTLVLVYAIGEALYRIATSPSITYKLLTGTGVVVGGGVLVIIVGFFTLLTHICM